MISGNLLSIEYYGTSNEKISGIFSCTEIRKPLVWTLK